MTSQILILIVIAIFAFAILRIQWNINEFRKTLWVGQHVDFRVNDKNYIAVIITDIEGEDVTVKSISKTFYDTKRKYIYPKK